MSRKQLILVVSIFLGLLALKGTTYAEDKPQPPSNNVIQRIDKPNKPKTRLYEQAGLGFYDGSFEATGKIQADRFFEFVSQSTPTTPSATHAREWFDNTRQKLCVRFDDGTSSCLGPGTSGGGGTLSGALYPIYYNAGTNVVYASTSIALVENNLTFRGNDTFTGSTVFTGLVTMSTFTASSGTVSGDLYATRYGLTTAPGFIQQVGTGIGIFSNTQDIYVTPKTNGRFSLSQGSTLTWVSGDGLGYIGLRSSDSVSTTVWTLPRTGGTANQVLTTDAQNNLFFSNKDSISPIKIGSGTIGPFDVSTTSASATGSGGEYVTYNLSAGSVTLRNVASGTQCLQADSSGNVSGTGGVCSASSGTVNVGTANQLAYYATSANSVSPTGDNLTYLSGSHSLIVGHTNNTSPGEVYVGANSGTSGQFTWGHTAGDATIVRADDAASDRIYTIPAVADGAKFVMTEGAQNVNGNKTFTSSGSFTNSAGVYNNYNLSSGSVTVRNIASGTQCVQADSSGNLTGTGAACGSGGVLAGGSTSYVQISNTLQASSTFYVSSGTVLTLNVSTLTIGTALTYNNISSTTFTNVSSVIFSSNTTLDLNAGANLLASSITATGRVTVLNGSSTTDATAYGQVKMDFIGHITASNQSTVDFTGITLGKYSEFIILVENLIPITNGTNLLLRTSTSGTFQTSSYRWAGWRFTAGAASGAAGSTSDSGYNITGTGDVGTGSNQTVCAKITLYNTPASPQLKYANWTFTSLNTGPTYVSGVFGGQVDSNSADIDGIRFLMNSGNISSGDFYVYGVRRL